MSCVIFGAGKIARGFIAHLLYLSKIDFVLVNKADSLVDISIISCREVTGQLA